MKTILTLCFFSLLATACTTNPERLAAPQKYSCIQLTEAVTNTAKRGLMGFTFYDQLGAGPYVSEKVDEQGTYFRGPNGTFAAWSDASNISKQTHNGGFWLPHDPNAPVRIYRYVSLSSVPPTPDVGDCNSVRLERDPATDKLSVVAFAAGGAAGGLAGRAMAPGSSISYGQSAVAGAIAGGLIAMIVNSELGEIFLHPAPEDPAFSAKIRAFASQAKTLEDAPRASQRPQPAKQ